MKKQLFIYVLVLLLVSSFTQDTLTNKELKNTSFKKGEELKYRLHYGWFTAGEATVKVLPELHEINGKPCYRMEVDGRSKGLASIVKVRDHWRSYIDTSTMIPQRFFRRIEEGKYKINETMFYDHEKGKVQLNFQKKNKDPKIESYDVPRNVHDIISGYYYIRNLDYSKMKKGDMKTIDAFLEDELYQFSVRFEGRETIDTELGEVKAVKLVPVMPDNELFEGEDAIVMWVSDDENKIPLKVKAKMFVGAVVIEVTETKGLRHKLITD